MAAQALERCNFTERKRQYILDVLDPILEDMVRNVLTEMPANPVEYMIVHLRRKAGLPTRTSAHAEVKNAFRSGSAGAPSSGSTSTVSGGYAEARTAAPKAVALSLVGAAKVAEYSIQVSPPAERALPSRSMSSPGSPGSFIEDDQSEEENSESDDDDDEVEMLAPPPKRGGPRASVSAEAYGLWNQKKAFVPPVYPKSEDQTERLRTTLNKSFLFRSLEVKDYEIVLLALKKVTFNPGANIITEGDEGDSLFMIESGHPVCKKLVNGDLQTVKQCEPGDVFGELALLYNAPRAASVDATDRCVCWQLDRETFNNIVKEAATRRTEQYDSFLRKVSLFFNMDENERAKLLDTLKLEVFLEGDLIVRQGDPGDKFYILEEGTLIALKAIEGKPPLQVKDYGVGDYFGELALLRNQPRAASIKVTSMSARVLSLDRKAFNSMLGPLEGLLRRGADKYS